jgi:hypothetical protein
MASKRKDNSESKSTRPPSTTLEGRENQMISLAVDLAEKQLREGTASAQVINHYLRLGTTREKLEQQKLQKENELLQIRADAIASAARIEELYSVAITAMRSYAGHEEEADLDEQD